MRRLSCFRGVNASPDGAIPRKHGRRRKIKRSVSPEGFSPFPKFPFTIFNPRNDQPAKKKRLFDQGLANGVATDEDWNEFAVAHYQDEEMENARREAVKLKLGYECSVEQLQSKLQEIAENLETK